MDFLQTTQAAAAGAAAGANSARSNCTSSTPAGWGGGGESDNGFSRKNRVCERERNRGLGFVAVVRLARESAGDLGSQTGAIDEPRRRLNSPHGWEPRSSPRFAGFRAAIEEVLSRV